eukprot:Amastigsp_a515809_32.p3 type:complete len:123 gc:universal Amastigsp_a515809_32:973-605(-)
MFSRLVSLWSSRAANQNLLKLSLGDDHVGALTVLILFVWKTNHPRVNASVVLEPRERNLATQGSHFCLTEKARSLINVLVLPFPFNKHLPRERFQRVAILTENATCRLGGQLEAVIFKPLDK